MVKVRETAEKMAGHKATKLPGDYLDGDGCLVCGKCKHRKEAYVDWLGGTKKLVPVMCECEIKRWENKQLDQERRQDAFRIRQIQAYGFAPSQLQDMTFKRADPAGENVRLAAAYARNFDRMKEENAGLLFYGNCGTGKTFLAGCIVNYLQHRNRTAFMTSVPILVQELSSWNRDDKTTALDRIRNCELLVIDDLGVEQEDRKSLEVAFRVIDARVKAGRPMIITSNLNGQDLMTDEMKYKRIYDRIKDVCKPVVFKGKSRRGRKNHPDKWDEVDRILEGESQ